MSTATFISSTTRSQLSNSDRLDMKLDVARPATLQVTNELVIHPQLKEIYPEFLVRVHWLIRFSVPIMETAIEACRQQPDDPVCAVMLPYLEAHVIEELGHDDLLLKDLEVLGLSREEVWRRLPPPPCVAAVQGAMHYWTAHHHPVAMFGSMIPSECYPTGGETIDWIQQRTGYPKAAFRTMELHSVVDVDHGREVLDAFDSLPLDDWHHEIVGVAALHFLANVTLMSRELLDEFNE